MTDRASYKHPASAFNRPWLITLIIRGWEFYGYKRCGLAHPWAAAGKRPKKRAKNESTARKVNDNSESQVLWGVAHTAKEGAGVRQSLAFARILSVPSLKTRKKNMIRGVTRRAGFPLYHRKLRKKQGIMARRRNRADTGEYHLQVNVMIDCEGAGVGGPCFCWLRRGRKGVPRGFAGVVFVFALGGARCAFVCSLSPSSLAGLRCSALRCRRAGPGLVRPFVGGGGAALGPGFPLVPALAVPASGGSAPAPAAGRAPALLRSWLLPLLALRLLLRLAVPPRVRR